MKKLIISLLAFSIVSASYTHAQMTDDAIIQYVTESMAAGKNQTQIASELAARGVSATQAQRVLARIKADGSILSSAKLELTGKIDENRRGREDSSPEKVNMPGQDSERQQNGSSKDPASINENAGSTRIIYGHDLFNSRNLTFEPNSNAATPDSYVLGPGDEVIIDIWGENEATIRQTISPEGLIMVSQIGPVQLAGLSIDAARARIRKSFASKYSALSGSASKVSVTLGKARTILVNVMGEVKVPGTYRLSSFATVFNALYNAGGITDIGSVRSVKVSRGNSIIANVDIYQYLFNGFASTDIPLKDGDVIIVPASSLLVEIGGKVKRPMFYELIEGETLAKALEYAGGFEPDAYKGDLSIIRQTGSEMIVRNVPEDSYGSFILQDGDSFKAKSALERFSDRLEIKGAVKRPGAYQFGGEVKTLAQLIERAGGLREDAFTGRAQLIREKDDLSLEILGVPLSGILNGSTDDIMLKGNDVLYISSINDIDQKGDFIINGYVALPGSYPYADNTSIEDLILLAGGLTDGASTARVEVSRRIVDPESTSDTGTYAEIFTFDIKDGLLADGKPDFILAPDDIVSVRKSPSFFEQKTIEISGEVLFPGQYTIQKSGERLSDIVNRAGGVTQQANLRGAMLKRRISEEEREIRKAVASVHKGTVEEIKDSAINNLVTDIYKVGVQLDKALAHPGSGYDIVLREGDSILIPEVNSTVTIQGQVLYPNTVPYVEGRSARFYIDQAGGFAQRSRKRRTYIVYANSSVHSGLNSPVEPGCAIVIPKKPERQAMTTSEAIGLGSSTVSLAAVVLSIINMLSPAK